MDDQELLLELRNTFLEELEDVLAQLESSFLNFEKFPTEHKIVHEIFRYFHNIKGSSKTVGFSDLSNFAHKAENLLAKIRDGIIAPSAAIVDQLLRAGDLMRAYSNSIRNGIENPVELQAHAAVLEAFLNAPTTQQQAPVAATENEENSFSDPNGAFGLFDEEPAAKTETAAVEPQTMPQKLEQKEEAGSKSAAVAKDESIKVSLGKINEILNLFGEQVILQSALEHALAADSLDESFIAKTVDQLKKITMELQHIVVTLRMVPLDPLFSRLERAVRDASRLTGKKTEFRKIGQSSELDKTIVDALIDPLTHMVRNAVDHGIEDPEMRAKVAKSDTGTITLSAQRSGGAFEIAVSDDGKGLDRDRILEKAKRKGLVPESAKLTDAQIYEMIFQSGFSTVENATEISGRGVGMDVVRQQIRKLKGVCTIASEKGKGSKFIIRVPLSLAMFNGTIVIVNTQRYVIPNSDISEIIQLSEAALSHLSGDERMVRVGERLLRVVDLRKTMRLQEVRATDRKATGQSLAIVVQLDDEEYALIVDDILSQDQIVLKELSAEAKQIRGASGSTILGDGKVALVLDVTAIIKREQLTQTKAA